MLADACDIRMKWIVFKPEVEGENGSRCALVGTASLSIAVSYVVPLASIALPPPHGAFGPPRGHRTNQPALTEALGAQEAAVEKTKKKSKGSGKAAAEKPKKIARDPQKQQQRNPRKIARQP